LVVLRTGIEDRPRDGNDVGRQRATPNRIFRDELEQRRIPEVVAAFEQDTLADQRRMGIEVRPQAVNVTGIEEVDRASKDWILNSLMVRQRQIVSA
jgi:hypothetical protein